LGSFFFFPLPPSPLPRPRPRPVAFAGFSAVAEALTPRGAFVGLSGTAFSGFLGEWLRLDDDWLTGVSLGDRWNGNGSAHVGRVRLVRDGG